MNADRLNEIRERYEHAKVLRDEWKCEAQAQADLRQEAEQRAAREEFTKNATLELLAEAEIRADRAEDQKHAAIEAAADQERRAVEAEQERGEALNCAGRLLGPVPTEAGGPGKEAAYWMRQKLDAAIRHLRDIEDYHRTLGGLPVGYNMIRADRARSLYEQISEDFLNGRISVPTMRERAEAAEARATRLETALSDAEQQAAEWKQACEVAIDGGHGAFRAAEQRAVEAEQERDEAQRLIPNVTELFDRAEAAEARATRLETVRNAAANDWRDRFSPTTPTEVAALDRHGSLYSDCEYELAVALADLAAEEKA